MKICLVSSAGGHLIQLLQLLPLVERYYYFHIINNRTPLKKEILNKTYFISRSHRDWKFFINLIESYSILKKEQPGVIISTGAGCAVPVSIAGKLFFKCKILYIESFAALYKPTLTGRIMYYLADTFIYQWEHLSKFYPKGIFGGSIY